MVVAGRGIPMVVQGIPMAADTTVAGIGLAVAVRTTLAARTTAALTTLDTVVTADTAMGVTEVIPTDTVTATRRQPRLL